MQVTLYPAPSRGHFKNNWLESFHTFSFSTYQNPERMGFGKLRVINDDTIQPAAGFATHPHQNMEIVTIPLSGALEHKDSVGNASTIHHGDVQLMSAGTGVTHSEWNGSRDEICTLFQIWVLPKKLDIEPRYEQASFSEDGRRNCWQTVVSPMGSPDPGLKINQDSYFILGDLEKGKELQFRLQRHQNGVYLLVISGEIEIGDYSLSSRDGIGIFQADGMAVRNRGPEMARVLAIEVPM